MSVERLWELLDVCRDRSDLDDFELPEAAAAVRGDPAAREYLEASLRFDRAVTKQLRQGESPVGFEQQILAVLASAATAGPETPGDSSAVVTSVESSQLEKPSRDVAVGDLDRPGGSRPTVQPIAKFGWFGRSRPLWLAASGLAATALIVLALSGKFRRTLEFGDLDTMARAWPEQVESGEWRSDLDESPADYPMARGLHAEPVGWQACPTGLDSGTVVYQLVTSRSRQQGLLFVATGAVCDLPEFPQTEPMSTTGNRCVGAWQANGCVYVLVVDGSASTFRRFVDLPVAGGRPGKSFSVRPLVALVSR